jgi:2-polyprenyl-3-methyl-5-hydroxy-6-metoxy-1,4-benzoquinol methylase
MANRIDQVKSFFAQPERYLSSNYNIRIRAEVVEGFVGDKLFRSILDIGCGNGAISLPLLRKDNQLTLLDISSNMLCIANSLTPAEFSDNVEMINEDFMSAELELQSYDLILCLGVLAHADSPGDVIARIASLLKPNGRVIVQNSNSHHPVGYLFNLYSKLRNILLPAPSILNRLSDAKLMEMFGNRRLKLIALYRYSLPIPGMARFFTSDSIYKFLRKIFGTCANNYRSWLGNEYIYYLKKDDI